jgi:hypothetical protein
LHSPRRVIRAWLPILLAAVVALMVSPLAAAQHAPRAQIRFTYENPKLQPQKYVVTVDEDGSGHFLSEVGPPVKSDVDKNDADSVPAGPQDRPIHISRELRQEMFAAARKNKLFAIACDGRDKNIAFQGTKTLEYEGPEGKGSCTYNWSKSSQIEKLTDQFESVATTLEEGAKLQRQYEHGRLSLDMEMQFLEQMVHEGRAIELENIAPILTTLAGDEAILQRVQRRARALLQGAKND